MSTVNISLPDQQVKQVDQFVSSYGFANRSEFIRSLLRLVTFKPELIQESATFPFVSPPKSIAKIMAGFKKSQKYSAKFLQDLQAGLESSDYFDK